MISRQDYETLKDVLRANSGHALGEGKEYLVERRLEPVAASLGFPDLASLIQQVRLTRDRKVVKLVCEAMTTNESLFFRDSRPFDLMKRLLLPDLVERRASSRKLRIWSAACSTGQEAYSLAMTLAEFTPSLRNWTLEIVGTDYSPSVVDRARAGVFNHFEVQRGLPVTHLVKYFDQVEDGWQVKSSLKSGLTFKEGNLLEPFSHLGVFDIVFCRNVLIYFDDEGKRGVLEKMKRTVAPDGYLLLGASETALGISHEWKSVSGVNTTLFQHTEATDEALRKTA